VATAIDAKDPHILAAMDGKELEVNDQNPQVVATTDRKEPTAFFFVMLGLVYEAIATASADASSESRSGFVSALTALKFLVRSEYSGQAIMEPMIFEEFISLCYRMGMTEAAGIQIHLIEMLAIFAASQQHSGSTGLDVLSSTSPPAHYLRICSHILKQATLPSCASSTRKLRSLACITTYWKLRTESRPSDRIAVISSAIPAFTSIANSITSSQREDVRSMAVLLYTGKTISCDQSSNL
jgi:hypothetical protein